MRCRMLTGVLLAGAAAVVARGGTGRAQEGGASTRPQLRVGTYQILVERITQHQYYELGYDGEPKGKPQVRGRRGAQVYLAVRSDTPADAARLSTFVIHTVTTTRGGKPHEVTHYGSNLENGDAALRMYVYAQDVSHRADEIRSIEGEIHTYARVEPVVAEFDLQNATYPSTQTVQGARLTLQKVAVQGGVASVELTVEPPAGAQPITTNTNRAYGLALSGQGWTGTPVGGQMNADGERAVQYSAVFQNVREAPTRLRVAMSMRTGGIHVQPFKLERIPLPSQFGMADMPWK